MHIPQFSPWIGDEEYQAIASCFKHNWITEGPESKKFEKKLLHLIGTRFGVFAPNGTLALYLGLRALGIGPRDEVLVPDFTFIGSATAVEMTGAKPIFVEVNRRNFQIDCSNAKRLLTRNTKAIMPVHIYGTIADMDQVHAFAKTHSLHVIEDAAQAIGVHRNGVHAGAFGDIGTFSFFADKTLTTGEGGFVVTNNETFYDRLLYLRNQGRRERGSFIHPEIGYNFRITDIQSAVGIIQIQKLNEVKKRKKHIADRYRELLAAIPYITFFEPDKEAEWIPFRAGILCDHAHELMRFLKKRNVEPRTFFYPLHRQPCFAYLNQNNDALFPNTIFGYEHGVCLPTFPTLTDKQVMYVCHVIKQFYSHENYGKQ